MHVGNMHVSSKIMHVRKLWDYARR